MVPSYHVHVLWVFYFEEKEQCNDFNTMSTSVNIITQKKITCIWQLSPDLKDLE